MDKFTSMKVFVAVAENGSFTAAAAKLHMSIAMVSKHVKRLEADFDTRLLNRTTREMRLTEAGRKYLSGCRQILQQLETLERQTSDFSAVVRGELTVVAPTSFGSFQLAPLISEFKQRYPDVQVQLSLTNVPLGPDGQDADVLLHIGALPDSSRVARQVGAMHLVCVAAPSYVAAHALPATIDDLDGHNCLRFSQGTRAGHWLFRVQGEDREVAVEGDFSASNGDAVRMAAISGQGLAQLPHYMVDRDLNSGTLVEVLAPFRPSEQPIFAVYNHRDAAANVKAFVDFLVDEC